MKLQYREGSNFVVIIISERISPDDVRVLTAGVSKLCREKKPDPVILDLTGVAPDTQSILPLSELQLNAFEGGADLFIISPNSMYGQFRTAQEANRLLISGASLMPLREQILTRLLRDLSERKTKLLGTEESLREKHIVKDRLPIENEQLKRIQQATEQYLTELLSTLDGLAPVPAGPESLTADLEMKLLKAATDGGFQVSALLAARRPNSKEAPS